MTEDAFYCGAVEVHKQPRRESAPFWLSEEEEPLLGSCNHSDLHGHTVVAVVVFSNSLWTVPENYSLNIL